MFIKYKGNTSKLLTELSLEIGKSVDLKLSETILKYFFRQMLEKASIEKSIDIITVLPQFIKPFCQKSKGELKIEHELLDSKNAKKTMLAILKVLEKHVPAESLPVLYSCFPDTIFPEAFLVKKEVFLAA